MSDGTFGDGAYGADLYGKGTPQPDAFSRALKRYEPRGKFYERPDPYGTQAHLPNFKPPLLRSKVPVGF